MAASAHPADRLLEAIERCGSPVCVGLDPVFEKLPAALRPSPRAPAAERLAVIERFCEDVLSAVAGVIPCVKPQSACFERYGSAGVAALERLIGVAERFGLEIILDAKRGDIGVSAEHYAEAAFAGAVDWVTINAYLGDDGIRPFLARSRDAVGGRGAFALVRTSNPGGDALQREPLASGGSVAERVAVMIAQLGGEHVGRSGFSALGAVVGATRPRDAAILRELMPQQIFLVPGWGAQGAGVAEIRPCFDRQGRGAIVTASRSVIFAGGDAPDWKDQVAAAARAFAGEVR
jgi:orotidine-5'-phosphate decarboxylase